MQAFLAAAFARIVQACNALALALSGKVEGPGSAVNNTFARYSGTTGKVVKESGLNEDDTGNVGIGTNAATGARLSVAETSEGAATVALYLQNASNTVSTSVRLALGANASAVSANRHAWIGAVNTGATNSAAVVIGTTPGSAAATERFRIDGAGLTTVRNTTGFGFSTGAGGTVTQAVSKATAVSLNRPTGRITMHGAELPAGEAVSFTLNNSTLTSVDLVMLVLANSSGVGAHYSLTVQGVLAGSVTFTLRNTSAAARSDALVFQYLVLKGSTS